MSTSCCDDVISKTIKAPISGKTKKEELRISEKEGFLIDATHNERSFHCCGLGLRIQFLIFLLG